MQTNVQTRAQVWEDGNVFEEQFINNEFNGQGVYKWSDGKTYDGEWMASVVVKKVLISKKVQVKVKFKME